MDAVRRVDAFQRNHGWAGLPLGVVYKFFDDRGPYLAALLTYYGFLSLFPLLLLLVTVLSGLLHGDPQLQHRILHSALSRFPVVGDQIGKDVHSFHSSGFALAVGIAGSVYGVSGVLQAAQHTLNDICAVPRCARLNPIHSRMRGLLFLVVPAAGLGVTTALSGVASVSQIHGVRIGAALTVGLTLSAAALNMLLLIAAYRALTHRPQALRALLPGAAASACVWQLVQLGGAYYVNHVLRGASATYGVFGIVLGLLAWIYLGALVFVLGAEFNSVHADRLWPRSLLTPFVDRVDLTAGDKETYSRHAVIHAFKTYQVISVTFRPPRSDKDR